MLLTQCKKLWRTIQSNYQPFFWPEAQTWRKGWFVEWLIDVFYNLIYMVPVSRKYKTGHRSLMKLLMFVRFHNGLIVNNVRAVKTEIWYRLGHSQLFEDLHKHSQGYGYTGAFMPPIILIITGVFVLMLLIMFLMAPDNTEYYIDSDRADDSGDGLSPGTAKKYLDLIDNGTFGPNDKIYIKRTGTYQTSDYGSGNDNINWNDSGTSGNPIVISAYGTGDLPVWDEMIFNNSGGDYVTFEYQNIVSTGGKRGIYINGNCTNQTIQHNTVVTTNSGILLMGGDVSNSVVQNNTVTTTGGGAILVNGVTGSPTSYVTFSTNTCSAADDCLNVHEGSNASDGLGSHFTLNDNICNSSGEDTIDTDAGSIITIKDNTVKSGSRASWFIDDLGHTAVFYRNKCSDYAGSNGIILMLSRNNTVWGNYFKGGSATPECLIKINANNSEGEAVTGNKIIKNTFLWGGESGDTQEVIISMDDNNDDMGTLEVSSNIFDTLEASMPEYVFWFKDPINYAYTDLTTANKNVYNGTFKALSTSDRSWATWQTAGYDANGVNSDPLLRDKAGGDYTLQNSSPARGLGPSTGTYNPDFNDKTTQNNAGAYEDQIERITIQNMTVQNMMIEVT